MTLVELDEVIKFICGNLWRYEHLHFEGVLYYAGWDTLVDDLKTHFKEDEK